MTKFSMTMIAVATMAGVATAQPKQADSKAGAPAVPAATATPAKPKPPAEIKAMLKQMGARHRCTGTGLGPDMKSEVKFTGTSTQKATLDGWFIQSSMTGKMGQGKTASTMKMESFMTYDPSTGKWRSIGAMNDGTTMSGTSEIKDGKITGTATMRSSMGEAMFRETGDYTNMKAGATFTGEMSIDKGKSWIKVYEMTCKK